MPEVHSTCGSQEELRISVSIVIAHCHTGLKMTRLDEKKPPQTKKNPQTLKIKMLVEYLN